MSVDTVRDAKGGTFGVVGEGRDGNISLDSNHEHLLNGEEIETHHIVPVRNGGSDDIDNLQHLHKACHKQVHSKKSKRGLEVRLEPDDW